MMLQCCGIQVAEKTSGNMDYVQKQTLFQFTQLFIDMCLASNKLEIIVTDIRLQGRKILKLIKQQEGHKASKAKESFENGASSLGFSIPVNTFLRSHQYSNLTYYFYRQFNFTSANFQTASGGIQVSPSKAKPALEMIKRLKNAMTAETVLQTRELSPQSY